MTDTVASVRAPRPSENPYIGGNFAPVEQEITAFDLRVTGEIPADLEGRWLRNGPNPGSDIDPAVHHWFLGAGMVHGVRLRGGRAEWYRNRRVVGDDGLSPNTNVGGFAGTTWAMVEAGTPPVELDYELELPRHQPVLRHAAERVQRPSEVRPGDRRAPRDGLSLA